MTSKILGAPSFNYAADVAWTERMRAILSSNIEIAPRDQPCFEGTHPAFTRVDPRLPLVTVRERALSHRFAAAEALWIIGGNNRVDGIAPYLGRMAEYSDDGVTLAGAYGPPFVEQVDYVTHAIAKDRDTRQATLTIWRPNPPPSKDVPCTVAMSYFVRQNALWSFAYMRSSDAYLGLPYDIFTFSMMARYVAWLLYRDHQIDVEVGPLTIYAASSHIYGRDLSKVTECLVPHLNNPERCGRRDALSHAYTNTRGDGWGAVKAHLLELRGTAS